MMPSACCFSMLLIALVRVWWRWRFEAEGGSAEAIALDPLDSLLPVLCGVALLLLPCCCLLSDRRRCSGEACADAAVELAELDAIRLWPMLQAGSDMRRPPADRRWKVCMAAEVGVGCGRRTGVLVAERVRRDKGACSSGRSGNNFS